MIAVHDLTQVYRSGKGVFDLDFSIPEGEVFGYLGPNGAGKTTTIRNLLGFTNARKGYATIGGLDCRHQADRIQKLIGYLPGEIAFFGNMTGIGFINFMENMRRTVDRNRRNALLDRFAFNPGSKIRKMSKGMKQKLGLITAFMHDPPVYILDEPTSGLDPFMQNVFMELLEEEKGRGKTVMLSSHIFEEVQRICDRAGIIREGRIVAIEDIASLNSMKQRRYVVTFGNQDDMERSISGPLTAERSGDRQLTVTVTVAYRDFLSRLSECAVVGLHSEVQTLESVFMKYYGREEDA